MAYIAFPDWISPTIVPGLPIQWYGLMYLVAFAVTYVLFVYQVRKRKLDVDMDTVTNLFVWAIVGLLIGGRLFATLIFDETGYYWRNPHRIFWPFSETGEFVGLRGMNYYGGLVGAVLAIVLYLKRKRVDVLDWGDMLVAGIPLGYTFGRLGNFINGELYGRVTSASWGVIFPNAEELPLSEPWVQRIVNETGLPVAEGAAAVNLPRHPTQLYEGLTEGILSWLIIWFLIRPRRPFPGLIIAVYMLSYGVFRFFIDYLRVPLTADYIIEWGGSDISPHLLATPWNIIPSQLFSLGMIFAGIALIFYFKRRWEQRSELGAAGARAGSTAAVGNAGTSGAHQRTARNRARRRRKR
jgi:phosphatidylglycerol:prolipoprotein diacylglycerol transferase